MSARAKKKPARGERESGKAVTPPRATLHASTNSSLTAQNTPASIPDLDKIIHERARLAIVSALATGSQTHNELRDLLSLTDGNLSVHARRLEEAGYISCDKDFAGRMPRTTYKLTSKGRNAFERYLSHMEGLIQMMKGR